MTDPQKQPMTAREPMYLLAHQWRNMSQVLSVLCYFTQDTLNGVIT